MLLRAGVKLPAPGGLGTMILLTMRGRKSGVPRTVPVVMGEQGDQRWLVSPFGEVRAARELDHLLTGDTGAVNDRGSRGTRRSTGWAIAPVFNRM